MTVYILTITDFLKLERRAFLMTNRHSPETRRKNRIEIKMKEKTQIKTISSVFK